MYSYRPLAQNTNVDYRSTFKFSGDKAYTEEVYGATTADFPNVQYMNASQTWIDSFCTSVIKILSYFLFIATLPFSAIFCFKLAHQYERIVMYRMGRLTPLKGPGIVLVLPCIDRWNKVDMRTKAFNIPPSRVVTKDRCLLVIGGVIHFRVQNPIIATNSVQDLNHSVRVIAQTVMSSVLSKKMLPEIMSNRIRYNYDIQMEINEVAKDWGIEIGRVELSQPTVEATPQALLNGGQNNSQSQQSFQMPGFSDGDSTMAGLAQFAQQFLAKQMTVQPPAVKEITEGEEDENNEMSAEDILNAAEMFITEDLVAKIDATYEIKLTDNNETYYLDLKSGAGSCGKGSLPSGEEADAFLTMSLFTMRKLLSGKIGPFSAYTNGKLKLKGNLKMAMRLDELVKCLK